MNTTRIGNLSEIAVAMRYIELGYVVSFPFGGSERYDLIVDDMKGNYYRIQVKTGRLKNGAITAQIKSPNKNNSYEGDIDKFAIFCPETKLCYEINYEEVPDVSSVTLRTSSPKKNRQDTKYAAYYKL